MVDWHDLKQWYLYRDVWSDLGSYNMRLWVRKDLADKYGFTETSGQMFRLTIQHLNLPLIPTLQNTNTLWLINQKQKKGTNRCPFFPFIRK